MPTDLEWRTLFVDLLVRLARGEVESWQWNELAVAHYSDETLERVRRDCVRLSIQKPDRCWSAEEIEQIHAWAQELRGTG
jgi:hypothetical protein